MKNPILVGAKTALKEYPLLGYVIRNGIALPVREKIVYRNIERVVEKEKKVYIREPAPDNIIVVPASTECWIRTGFTFYVNNKFVIDVYGTVTIDGGKTWIGSDGKVVMGQGKGTIPKCKTGKFPEYPLGAIVGRVSGWRFQVKNGQEHVCKSYGEMVLMMNDTTNKYRDNVCGSSKTGFWCKIRKVRN